MADAPRRLLFTAFEPSGDDLASVVIAEIRRCAPDVEIFAWGGPKMESAGAKLVERTGDNAVMGLPGLGKILEHKRLNKRVEAWLDENPIGVHVAVDSPAANYPICALAKARGAKTAKIVAPQLWAWAPWRIKKVRRLLDRVMCVLPFEPEYFIPRGLDAVYVGHPVYSEPLDEARIEARLVQMPPCRERQRRVCWLPGSRPAEIEKNWPVMLAAWREMRASDTELLGVVAATTDRVRDRVLDLAEAGGGLPEGGEVLVGEEDAALRWSNFAVATSGTVTLRVARHRKPLVGMFVASRWQYYTFAKWLLQTPWILLPNIVLGREAVPELIPYWGDHKRLLNAIQLHMGDESARGRQRADYEELAARFGEMDMPGECAAAILQMLSPPSSSPN